MAEIIGYIPVMDINGTIEPVSYGDPDDTSPHLLLRYGRAQFFESKEECRKEIEKTLDEANKQGARWVKKYRLGICPVYKS